ncbi:MAG TPA: hypothetical protein VJO14_03175 [Bacteroidota bacterium]|nr:hypothetical protein [Bacteroidota bacterium]
MTKTEQHKIIQALREYEHRLRGREADEFQMMRKRDTDDEELDRLSVQKLLGMYEKYVPERYR